MLRLLVVDDEIKIREMISKYATHEGYEVVCAKDGLEAVEIFRKESFDVVIMDVMMPNLDGYSAFMKMKEIRDVHCIFLTALGEEYDRIYGFDIGGEDYVTKPFSLKELMHRIKVITKRDNNYKTYQVSGLIVDDGAHRVSVDGKEISLSKKEYELLLMLISNRGIVLSRERIITNIWGYEYDSDDRTLDTHMKLLRKDIAPYGKYITTLRGVGYRFEKEIES